MSFFTEIKDFFALVFSKIPLPKGMTWILILLVAYLIYRVLTRKLEEKVLKAMHGDVSKAGPPLRAWTIFFWSITIILFLASTGGNLATLGLSAAFLGMVLGWSLQRPVTGIAAWFLVVILRPFKVGDRVIIAGIIGDVKHIGVMYITMEQVGGTIGGEEKSGRAVLIPTAVLFDQVIMNYTMREVDVQESKYILDEIVVRISYESKWDVAEKILIDAASQVTKDVIAEIKKEPFIRAEFIDWGIFMRLRYYTKPTERQEISTNITKIIFHEFSKSKEARFAYPRSEADITYIAKDGLKPPMHP